MIKLLILVKRNPALTYEEFREHLSVRHSQLVRDCPASKKHVRKYVQSYRVHSEKDSFFDGAAELWFDTPTDMEEFFAHPDYLSTVRPDEPVFADLQNCVFLTTEEAQII